MQSEIAMLQNNTKERDLHISRLESEMAILPNKDQEKDQHIASLESAFYKLREEIISKSADDKHPEEAVMHPVTPPPTVNKEVPQPTNKNPKDFTSNISMTPKDNITFTYNQNKGKKPKDKKRNKGSKKPKGKKKKKRECRFPVAGSIELMPVAAL
jgi:hypothetical protein